MRVIYKYALDRIPKQDAQNLFKSYTIFEKKFGDRRGIEDIIVSKRRFQYEEEVKVRGTGTLQAHCTVSWCLRDTSILWYQGWWISTSPWKSVQENTKGMFILVTEFHPWGREWYLRSLLFLFLLSNLDCAGEGFGLNSRLGTLKDNAV